MAKRIIDPINSESPDEVIKSLLIRKGDIAGVNFLRYKSVVPEVYRDLNLYVIKFTKRYLIEVDKDTNSFELPCDSLIPASVSYIDECNKIRPLIINRNITDDIVDISQDKDCHCECGCKSDLCGLIHSYESIVTDTIEQLPNGTTEVFTSTTRKRMDADGKFVIERTFPVRKYEDGTWVGVELETEIEELCELEVSECGCVKNTEDNVCKVNACCNADTFKAECGDTICDSVNSTTYNFSEQNRRIILPTTFGYKKVLYRYFGETGVKDMRIPLIAKPAFINGLEATILPFDDTQPLWRIRNMSRMYSDAKDDLFTLMNRFSMRELNQVLNPERNMP